MRELGRTVLGIAEDMGAGSTSPRAAGPMSSCRARNLANSRGTRGTRRGVARLEVRKAARAPPGGIPRARPDQPIGKEQQVQPAQRLRKPDDRVPRVGIPVVALVGVCCGHNAENRRDERGQSKTYQQDADSADKQSESGAIMHRDTLRQSAAKTRPRATRSQTPTPATNHANACSAPSRRCVA